MRHISLSKDIGTVHDIDQFDFIAEIEDFYYKELNKEVEVEILQDKSSTEGLLHLRLVFKNGETKIINDDRSFELIEKVFDVKPSEVYVNFAAHIVYFIVLTMERLTEKDDVHT